MKSTLLFLEKYAIRPLERISRQRHLSAIRNGIMAAFPISLIGSFFMLFTVIPLPQGWGVQKFLAAHENLILIPYQVTSLILALYIVVGVGCNLAKYYGYSQVSGCMIALVTFFMTVIPGRPASVVPADFLERAASAGIDTSWVQSLEAFALVIPIKSLGATSAFLGCFSAILGVETIHLVTYLFSRTKRPKKVLIIEIPASLVDAIANILPIALVVSGMFVIRDILKIDFQNIIDSFFLSFVKITNSLPGALLSVFLLSIFLFLGMKGFSVHGSSAGFAFAALLQTNEAAHLGGQTIPNVAPYPFFQWFVWVGGTGATLSLVLLLCFSKSTYLKKLGRACLLPSLVNINDPVVYGAPVILNPYLLIPFVTGPLLTTLFSYITMSLGLVGKVYSAPPPNLPGSIGAFVATGDWKAILLCLVNIGICGLVYFPFFKMYEKKLISEGEKRAQDEAIQAGAPPHVTSVE